ncbi:hypothetical protein ME763_36840 (plasmid) [Streptomyces murinus]|uniref:hypothetical protein n=1 Tax=Streptomyces murinus TaxID=33900 RepID=UPI001181288F|nr:hypothetical protein [Streptomyces murinus]WDO11307.1 hypothetical protein ME763_36840 [Streptomyces murinus]
MTTGLWGMAAEDWSVRPTDLAVISPQRRANVLRFGDCDTAGLHVLPSTFDPRLDLGHLPS